MNINEFIEEQAEKLAGCKECGGSCFSGCVNHSQKHLLIKMGFAIKEEMNKTINPVRLTNIVVNVGDTIHITKMEDNKDYVDKEGVVEGIGTNGQLYGTWGDIAVIPGLDFFYIVKQIID